MKILILANNDVGLYRFRAELLQALAPLYEVTVSLPDGVFVPQLKAMGCRFIDTPISRRGTNPIHEAGLLINYLRMIRRVRPDLVLTYTVKPNIYGGLACRLSGIPYIANITGLGTSIENGGLLSRLVLRLYRQGLKKARCVFFQNSRDLDFITQRHIFRGRRRLLPGSGVNLSAHAPLPYPDDKLGIRFLFIGRVMRDKGVEELFHAARETVQQHSEASFFLAGECDEDYEKELAALQKEGIVHPLGFVEDIRAHFANCHCVILPSYHEGMANVLLEAAATARPVIATRVPGCRETFDEGVSGLGCDKGDAGDLTRAVLRFLALPHQDKAAMGRAGREKMEREFSRAIVVAAYLEEISNAS